MTADVISAFSAEIVEFRAGIVGLRVEMAAIGRHCQARSFPYGEKPKLGARSDGMIHC